MHTLLLLCIDLSMQLMAIDRQTLEINERIRKIDLIELNIRCFIYFIEYLYLWFITIDFRRLSAIDIILVFITCI